MTENFERIIKVGQKRAPKKVFDEIECATAQMIRQGYTLTESFIEEGLGNIHLIFNREIISLDTLDMKSAAMDN
jgi:septation ring formation regulator EzrA